MLDLPAGPYHENFNAAIFLEHANGGTSNVEVRDNWLLGSAFSVMVDSQSATFTGNKIGGDIKWGPCLQLDASEARGSPARATRGSRPGGGSTSATRADQVEAVITQVWLRAVT